MARHGLPMGGNESYGLQEAFGTPPGPLGGHEKIKNPEKPRKSGFPGSAAWAKPLEFAALPQGAAGRDDLQTGASS